MDGKPVENPKDRLAALLAAGHSLNHAAKSVGIPYTTARRISQKPEFKQKVNTLAEAFVQEAVKVYAGLLRRAGVRLGMLLGDADKELSYKAARAVVVDYVALNEHVVVSEKIEELTERLAGLEDRATDPHANGRY
jgi:hypothetical protein